MTGFFRFSMMEASVFMGDSPLAVNMGGNDFNSFICESASVGGNSERKEPHTEKNTSKKKFFESFQKLSKAFKSRTLVGLISLQQPSFSVEESAAVIRETP